MRGLNQPPGLKNFELYQFSILDVTPALGKFDYFIFYGVYSRVPILCPGINTRNSQVFTQSQGIAYIRNNTYLGWPRRGMIRDMLFFKPASSLYLEKRRKWNPNPHGIGFGVGKIGPRGWND